MERDPNRANDANQPSETWWLGRKHVRPSPHVTSVRHPQPDTEEWKCHHAEQIRTGRHQGKKRPKEVEQSEAEKCSRPSVASHEGNATVHQEHQGEGDEQRRNSSAGGLGVTLSVRLAFWRRVPVFVSQWKGLRRQTEGSYDTALNEAKVV